MFQHMQNYNRTTSTVTEVITETPPSDLPQHFQQLTVDPKMLRLAHKLATPPATPSNSNGPTDLPIDGLTGTFTKMFGNGVSLENLTSPTAGLGEGLAKLGASQGMDKEKEEETTTVTDALAEYNYTREGVTIEEKDGRIEDYDLYARDLDDCIFGNQDQVMDVYDVRHSTEEDYRLSARDREDDVRGDEDQNMDDINGYCPVEEDYHPSDRDREDDDRGDEDQNMDEVNGCRPVEEDYHPSARDQEDHFFGDEGQDVVRRLPSAMHNLSVDVGQEGPDEDAENRDCEDEGNQDIVQPPLVISIKPKTVRTKFRSGNKRKEAPTKPNKITKRTKNSQVEQADQALDTHIRDVLRRLTKEQQAVLLQKVISGDFLKSIQGLIKNGTS
jgi:hypothetical protein